MSQYPLDLEMNQKILLFFILKLVQILFYFRSVEIYHPFIFLSKKTKFEN